MGLIYALNPWPRSRGLTRYYSHALVFPHACESRNDHVSSCIENITNPLFTVLVLKRVCVIQNIICFNYWAHDKGVASCKKNRIRKAGRKWFSLWYNSAMHSTNTNVSFIQPSKQQQLVAWHLKLVSFLLNFFGGDWIKRCVREMSFIPLNHLSKMIFRLELT